MSAAPGVPARPADGHFLEDFEVGRRFAHGSGRTLGPGEAALYIALTGARQQAHCAEPLARAMGHAACPVDDLLAFHIAFGQTVHDISRNAIANLGYADVRFLAPVYAGDTLACDSLVTGVKHNANGLAGVVYVHSSARNQHGIEVLRWDRWVMVPRRAPGATAAPAPRIPELPAEVRPADFQVPAFLDAAALVAAARPGTRFWEDYAPGERIDHPGGMTLEESDHMLATRLYQNGARVHFDARLAAGSPHGRRLVYGGHVISLCRALSHDGLENAFAIAAIHGGSHAHPTFAGDTLYCAHVVRSLDALPGRRDLGALRLRMLGITNQSPAQVAAPDAGAKHPAVVLDLDYSVLIPRRDTP